MEFIERKDLTEVDLIRISKQIIALTKSSKVLITIIEETREHGFCSFNMLNRFEFSGAALSKWMTKLRKLRILEDITAVEAKKINSKSYIKFRPKNSKVKVRYYTFGLNVKWIIDVIYS